MTNGRIHTMDTSDTIVESVRIVGDRFAEVGTTRLPTSRCTRTIDLEGRTAVPGLIDNHNHIVLLGLAAGPRHAARVRRLDRRRAGARLSARCRAAERRMDHVDRRLRHQSVRAAARRAALSDARRARYGVTESSRLSCSLSFAGPSTTNTRGKQFFEQAGIEVGADGAIAGGWEMPNPTTRALYELRKLQTLVDQKRGTQDAMRYAASLGLTTHLDQGGFPATGTNADAAAHFDRYRAYDALLDLYAEGALTQRIRLNFLHMETDVATPELAARLANVFPNYGDDLLKIVGIGEFTAGASPIIAEANKVWRNGTTPEPRRAGATRTTR